MEAYGGTVDEHADPADPAESADPVDPARETDVEPDESPDESEVEPDEPFERPVDRFRRGAIGGVVAAGLLGIADALEGRPRKEEVVIVQEAPAAPPREPRRLELLLDPDDPSKSLVFLPAPAPASPTDAPDALDASDPDDAPGS